MSVDWTPRLTEQQVKILLALAEGSSYLEVAGALGLTEATIRKRIERLYAKLGAATAAQAVAKALRGRLIE